MVDLFSLCVCGYVMSVCVGVCVGGRLAESSLSDKQLPHAPSHQCNRVSTGQAIRIWVVADALPSEKHHERLATF